MSVSIEHIIFNKKQFKKKKKKRDLTPIDLNMLQHYLQNNIHSLTFI